MPIRQSGSGGNGDPEKTVYVVFTPSSQSFAYSGDIDPTTEEIVVQGTVECTITFLLEGATWASEPIKWVTPQKAATSKPFCMDVESVDSKTIKIHDNCHEGSAGTFAFLVCVNNNGTNVCSDPRINNDPDTNP